METVWCILIGYGLGNINPSYILARLKGFDIRTKGSGNAGATNAMLTLGKTAGIFSALFDIVKACVAFWLAGILFPDFICAGELAGTFCILGHIFPVYMRFQGGKGLACLGGVILSFNYIVFLILLACELVLVLAVNYLCVVPISAAIVFPIIYWFMTKKWEGTLIFSLASVVIIWKHRINLRRIQEGKEVHFSYLWNKKEEEDRISSFYSDNTHNH